MSQKTAISLPDDLYRQVEKTRKKHGMKRSRFLALALEEYLKKIRDEELVKAIAEVEQAGDEESGKMTEASRRAARSVLETEEW